MTSERNRESRNMSRPLPSRATKCARPCLSNSFYEASRPTEGVEGHPVDVVIDRLPKVASLCRRLLRLAKRWQGEVSDAQAFIAYEDLRLEYLRLREQGYFAGRAESHAASAVENPAVRAFAHQVGLAAAVAKIPQPRIAAALMEIARAMVLGLPLR
jgi:hypothetical protein